MGLYVTTANRCLDRKLQIGGFEVFDLLLVFITLAILNFIFGNTSNKLLLIWAPTATLAAILRVSKRGKPENYLLHWIRFQFSPGHFEAFDDT